MFASFRILIILCSLLISGKTNAQVSAPGFKEVVMHFFLHYEHDDPETYLQFYRNKEGWFAAKDYYANPGNRFDKKLIWSKKTGKYVAGAQPLEDSAVAREQVSLYFMVIDGEYEDYSFSRNLYYGYPGWEWDVIQETKNLKNKPDSLLEGMGRAYMSYATGFAGTQMGEVFENGDADRMPLSPTAPLSASRLEKYIQYELKAIEAYEQLWKQNPAYETLVGNIQIKLANEYMTLANELMTAGRQDLAVQYASKAQYPDSLLQLARLYLDDTPANSWLLTAGDNDTYPLWYLQWAENYRTDVKIVNYSLLGFPRFVYQLDKKNDFRLFKTPPELYTNHSFDYFRYSNKTGNEEETSVGKLLQSLRDNDNPHNAIVDLRKGEPYRTYNSKNVYLQRKPGGEKLYLEVGDYILRHDYMLLDLLVSNPGLQLFATYPFEFLQPGFESTGSVYEFRH